MVLLGTSSVLAGIATLCVYGALWLLEGTWTGWSFGAVMAAAGLNNLSESSGSANGVIQSFLAWPAAVGLVGVGLLVAGIGSGARSAGKKREREHRSKAV